MARDKAFQIAQIMIQNVQYLGRKELHLSFNGLSEVPKAVGELTKLEELYLKGNQLTSLPDSLGQLAKLQKLHLDGNRLRSLPESLGQLTKLQELFIHKNKLKVLPKSLGELTMLRELNVHDNQLRSLPESLGQLTTLQELRLDNNQLHSLPESLGQLTKLSYLCLDGNRLTTLPESVGRLTKLQVLHVYDNQLTSLPDSLQQLTSLRELYLHGNDKLDLPPEILGPEWGSGEEPADPRAILAFYFAKRKQTAKPLNEVKLLLVGHGRVGKTSLSKALRRITHNEREPETPGIERYPLKLATGKAKITAHLWDFGGQEFLHQTHQFFFSERSIYVVVLSGRQGRPMQEAEYWLRLIRTYGIGSPVVIALNQIKGHPFTVDEHFLQENYPEVSAVVETDCDPPFGIEPLRRLLGELAGKMPSVREKIDPAWARVRTQLENMPESFVTFDRYREICGELGVKTSDQQETLATILDCLGIALNYRNDPRLRDTSVLKPRWLVDGIYTILRWLHKQQTNGEMRLGNFPKALKDKRTYPANMHQFLLALMEKFELCFPVDGEKGLYVVPALLDANQPHELKKFVDNSARRIQFRYEDVRPPGLLPRFIVRSHTLSVKQPRWLRGVVLARGKARALVRGDHEGRVTDVFALGDETDDRVWLTEFILSEMRVLHDKLPVRTFVESEGQPGAWTELELLRDAARREEKSRTERAVGGNTVQVRVKETLREVESEEANAPPDNPLPLFICYARANERDVRQLIPSLKVLSRRGYITPWRDTDLVAGEDWDDTIKQRLSEAKVILLVVSRHFLASEYITEQELPLAMKLLETRRATVVPVLLSPCAWEDEVFAKLVNLPQKGAAVSSFSPREKAWFLVEEGLKEAVEKARKLLGTTGLRRHS